MDFTPLNRFARWSVCLLLAVAVFGCKTDDQTAADDDAVSAEPDTGENDAQSSETGSQESSVKDGDSNQTGGESATKQDAEDQTPVTADETSQKDAGQTPTGALRHAVFFSFKEESTPEDVQGVADAFAALPDKIDAITGFSWGTNNSPEGLDDGFTHCFLLTFADDQGRQTYLPHEAHKAFGDVLRPHMKDVFVIDYWGDPQVVDKPGQIKHAVFFKFKDDANPAAVKAVEEAFAALPSKIDSITGFEWGINNSPERHDDGFTHCFMVTFDDDAGRAKYLPHPDHLAFVEVLKPVLDKVRVLDFTVTK